MSNVFLTSSINHRVDDTLGMLSVLQTYSVLTHTLPKDRDIYVMKVLAVLVCWRHQCLLSDRESEATQQMPYCIRAVANVWSALTFYYIKISALLGDQHTHTHTHSFLYLFVLLSVWLTAHSLRVKHIDWYCRILCPLVSLFITCRLCDKKNIYHSLNYFWVNSL